MIKRNKNDLQNDRKITWKDIRETMNGMGWGLSPRGFMLYFLLNMICGIILMARGVNFFDPESITIINKSIVNLVLFYGGFAVGLFGFINLFKFAVANMAKYKETLISIQHESLFKTLESDIAELLKENMK